MKNVLLLETIPDRVLDKLKASLHVIEAFNHNDAIRYSSENNISAIITRGKGQVDKNLITNNKNLEVIARCGVGLDNVDVVSATKRSVKVINAPGSNSDTMAEHTFALMLNAVRAVYQSIQAVRNNDWAWRNKYSGDEIRGKTLGIVGMGNIGTKVANLSKAFGMNVLYWDQRDFNNGFTYSDFDTLLEKSDVISIHLPLIPQTKSLFSKEQFSKMKNTAYLINTARGAVVNTDDLLNALDTEEIAGYTADVLDSEPPASDNTLVTHPKAFITPHSGSLTKTTYFKMCDTTIENVISELFGNSVDKHFVFNHKDL